MTTDGCSDVPKAVPIQLLPPTDGSSMWTDTVAETQAADLEFSSVGSASGSGGQSSQATSNVAMRYNEVRKMASIKLKTATGFDSTRVAEGHEVPPGTELRDYTWIFGLAPVPEAHDEDVEEEVEEIWLGWINAEGLKPGATLPAEKFRRGGCFAATETPGGQFVPVCRFAGYAGLYRMSDADMPHGAEDVRLLSFSQDRRG